jgi:hypothetical protein
VSDGADLPWRGALAAGGMTLGVVALAFVAVSALQDPARPVPPEVKALQERKRAEVLATAAPTCGPADLDLVAAVHGPKGAAPAHKPDQDLTVWLAAVNPCATPVTFTTPTLCLFDGFELRRGDEPPRRGGTMCAQAVSTWTVEPGDAARVSFLVGNLPAGDWRVTSAFTATGASTEARFRVAP